MMMMDAPGHCNGRICPFAKSGCCTLSIGCCFPSFPYLVLPILAYLALVRLLRYRRAAQIRAYVRKNTPLTPATAQPALHAIVQLEFPTFHETALQFALFRTYGIPSISSLLTKTSLLSSQATSARRYVDTSVLVAEIIARPWGSSHWITPMARVNAIHAHYRERKGQRRISEADMLYTLALMACEPWRWIGRHEWRELSEEEINVLGTFWRGVGEAMEIKYDKLGVDGWVEETGERLEMGPNGVGKGTWADGAEWLKAIYRWVDEYEKKHMVPAESNRELADQTIAVLLYEFPKSLHGIGRQFVSALMDKRLRRAMMVADPHQWVQGMVDTMLPVRKYFIKYLCPPRPEFLKVRFLTELWEATPEGRYHLLSYDTMPYYIQPTFSHRWSLHAWKRWLLGLPLPGDDGMGAQGYHCAEIGPAVGKTEREQERRELMVADALSRHGCPMAFKE